METKNKQEAPKKKKKSGSTALKVAGGVLAGAAAGALAGVLMAPDSGKNTRKKITDKSKKIAADAKTTVKGKLNQLKSKLKKTPVKKK